MTQEERYETIVKLCLEYVEEKAKGMPVKKERLGREIGELTSDFMVNTEEENFLTAKRKLLNSLLLDIFPDDNEVIC